MPWTLILGGTGIGLLLLLRIAIVKCLRCIKNNQVGNIWYEIGVTIHNHLSDLLRWRGWLFLRVWLQRDVRHHAHGRHRYVDGACHLVGLQVRLSFQQIDFNWKYPWVSGIGLLLLSDHQKQTTPWRTISLRCMLIINPLIFLQQSSQPHLLLCLFLRLILACALIVFLVDKIFTKLVCCRWQFFCPNFIKKNYWKFTFKMWKRPKV